MEKSTPVLTVVCIKQGPLYGAEYVNILYSMVERNLSVPHEFVCFTDDPEGLQAGIRFFPPLSDRPGWWSKMELYRETIPGVNTPRILFLDLDVVVTGSLDIAVRRGFDFCLIRDYPAGMFPDADERSCHGNTSVILLTVGSRTQIYNAYVEAGRPETPGGDQEWVNRYFIGEFVLFPDEWMRSYKLHNLQDGLTEGCKVVMFHGRPKPPECGGWVKEYWK